MKDLTFPCRRVAWINIHDLHILGLESFLVTIRLGLMAKGFNQNWFWPFVLRVFQFNITGYDGHVKYFDDFDNSILCTQVQVF